MFTLVDKLLPIHSTSVLSKPRDEKMLEDPGYFCAAFRSTPDSPTPCSASQLLTCGNCSNAPLCYFPLSLSRELQGHGIRKVRACIAYTPLCTASHWLCPLLQEKTLDKFQSIDQSINQPSCLSPHFPSSFHSLPTSLSLLALALTLLLQWFTHLTFLGQKVVWYVI